MRKTYFLIFIVIECVGQCCLSSFLASLSISKASQTMLGFTKKPSYLGK